MRSFAFEFLPASCSGLIRLLCGLVILSGSQIKVKRHSSRQNFKHQKMTIICPYLWRNLFFIVAVRTYPFTCNFWGFLFIKGPRNELGIPNLCIVTWTQMWSTSPGVSSGGAHITRSWRLDFSIFVCLGWLLCVRVRCGWFALVIVICKNNY